MAMAATPTMAGCTVGRATTTEVFIGADTAPRASTAAIMAGTEAAASTEAASVGARPNGLEPWRPRSGLTGRGKRLEPFEQRSRQIALSERWDDDHDRLAGVFLAPADVDRGCDGGA